MKANVSLAAELSVDNQPVFYRDVYRKINQGFESKFVHRFGEGFGFCSEYIYVMKGVALCLEHEVQFCLQENRNAKGFAFERGWEDYFEPLFPIVSIPAIGFLNRYMFPGNRIPILREVSRPLLRAISGCDYFMFDCIGDGNISGKAVNGLYYGHDYWRNMKILCNMLWKYNNKTENALTKIRQETYNAPYLAAHIRRGDKLTEHSYVQLQAYIDEIKKHAHKFSGLYIATDDYRVIQELKQYLKGIIQIWYSELKSNNGYNQEKFNSENKKSRMIQTLQFFAELEMLFKSDLMIGTETSNVFCLCRYMRGNTGCIGL